MSINTNVTDEEAKKMAYAYESGSIEVDIAKQFKRSLPTVRKYLKKQGCYEKKSQTPPECTFTIPRKDYDALLKKNLMYDILVDALFRGATINDKGYVSFSLGTLGALMQEFEVDRMIKVYTDCKKEELEKADNNKFTKEDAEELLKCW